MQDMLCGMGLSECVRCGFESKTMYAEVKGHSVIYSVRNASAAESKWHTYLLPLHGFTTQECTHSYANVLCILYLLCVL